MEWVETTGRTVDDAKEAALDQLGVDENDAEFEIVEEPRTGLFGRLRGEARVRARVRPTRPRAKVDRRDRGRRRREGQDNRSRSKSGGGRTRAEQPPAGDGGEHDAAVTTAGAQSSEGSRAGGGSSNNRRRRSRGRGSSSGRPSAPASNDEGTGMGNDATVEEQAEMSTEFLSGLVDAFELSGSIVQERIDEETIEVRVEGDDLGLLIGPKGQTLQALQELTRTVIQRRATGTHHGRIRLDVAGYRQRRKEALARFTEQVAAQVLQTGSPRALEPMHPADRKVVHDTVNEIEGVVTSSEGEEQRRHVVISPAPAPSPSQEGGPVEDTAPEDDAGAETA